MVSFSITVFMLKLQMFRIFEELSNHPPKFYFLLKGIKKKKGHKQLIKKRTTISLIPQYYEIFYTSVSEASEYHSQRYLLPH